MSEMIERVAKAIAAEAGAIWPQDANRYRRLARVAIEAMRGPTDPMIDRFVSRALCTSISSETGGWSGYACEQWDTMIEGAFA